MNTRMIDTELASHYESVIGFYRDRLAKGTIGGEEISSAEQNKIQRAVDRMESYRRSGSFN